VLAACLCACRAGSPEPPRLVVLYATCTVNKDYLSPYNEEVVFTPNFARFGRGAAVLTSHQTESGVSGTAFASIYAGVQADRHGVFKHPKELDNDLYLMFGVRESTARREHSTKTSRGTKRWPKSSGATGST